MTHDPSMLATAVSVISNAVSTAKNAVELAKSATDRELKTAVGDVLDAVLDSKLKVMDLGDENRALRDRVSELEAQLKQRGAMSRNAQTGLWFQDGDPCPLCPKCWEGESRIAHLAPPRDGWWRCPVCGWCRVAGDAPKTQGLVSGSESITSRARGYWG